MAIRAVLLPSLLALRTWVLLAHWPIDVRGSSEARCGSSAPPAICYPSDPIRNLWQVNITDCSVPDAITVSIVDDPSGDRSDFNNANLNEVRLNCTDENAQTEVSVACSDIVSGLGYVTFSNLSAFGIQPGWTCSISGCFLLSSFGDSTYVHTPNVICTLPTESAPTVPTPTIINLPSMTSTKVPTITSKEVPTTTSNELPTTEVEPTTSSTSTDTEVESTTNSTRLHITDFQVETALIVISVVLVPVFVVLLITIVLLMILILSRLKKQKALQENDIICGMKMKI